MHNEETTRVEVIVRKMRPDGSVEQEKVCGTIGAKFIDDFDIRTEEGFQRDLDTLEDHLLEMRDAVSHSVSELVGDDVKKKSLKTSVSGR